MALFLLTVLGSALAFSSPPTFSSPAVSARVGCGLPGGLRGAASPKPLTSVPTSSFSFTPGGNGTNGASDSAPNSVFVGNATFVTRGTVRFNFVGTGGNDTFDLYGGNASAIFLATGVLNDTFNVVTGDPATATNSSTFSLIGGANSTFSIIQDNFNGSVSLSITGGPNSLVNDTSWGPVSNTVLSISLGGNSTASLSSLFAGNETTINVVY